MRVLALLTLTISSSLRLVAAQTIYDVWQTTWDKSKLLSRSTDPNVNFVTKGAIGDADIVVSDGAVYQQMDVFGATLTDSSALVLNNLKSQNSANYWALLNQLFDVTDGAATAGFSVLRLNLGASDFSASAYSYDDKSGDTTLASFSLESAPPYLWSVLDDIHSINSGIKLYVLPWSPPAWMKSPTSMNGGALQTQYNGVFAQYLLKIVQELKTKGFTVYAVNPQNEPENPNTTYPSALMPYNQEAAIGQALRPLLDNNGFSSVKIVGFEHNWEHAGNYPVSLMQTAGSSFAGVSFHCYKGSVSDQDTFHAAYPDKEIYFTECTGSFGTDWWADVKWNMDNIAIGAPEHWARTALMWNLASDAGGGPKFPGTDSCSSAACRAVVTINSDGSYTLNQEYYPLAQASRAILPKDAGGAFGQRIGVTVGGSQSRALRVSAFVTKRKSNTDYNRYSIVVLNWDDSASTTWNPQAVKTTIEFRGVQATYTFPVGVTTLWWFAAA
ncbi:glycoside hydrolase family 30 protein [Ceratobasidium sp. AG-I]|nr:glycoside hydrolase family 30 protein [Ceratobasidium sp. AG-I]